MLLSRSAAIRRVVVVTLALLLVTLLAGLSRAADASVLPSGFRDTVVLSGMTNPTLARRLPNAAGSDNRRLCGLRPGLQADCQRQYDDRCRAGAGGGLVPAVPESFHRDAAVRPGRRAVRRRG